MSELIYNLQEIQETKKSLHFRNTSYIWNQYHFNAAKNVGKCSKTAQEYSNFCIKSGHLPSLREYQDYYFKNAITREIFAENSKKFALKLRDAGIKITYERAAYYQWIRVIYDSFYGIVKKETDIFNYLKNDSNYVEHSDEETDRKYSIDLIILNSEGYFEGVQVKPISFYYGVLKQKEDIIKDFGYCINGQKKWLDCDGNKKVKWLFYNNDEIVEKDFSEVLKLYERYTS